jgi:hypothetical protein
MDKRINLVDLSKYNPSLNLSNPSLTLGNSIFTKVVKPKWNLNKIVLIVFFVFMAFFLYNCKYGIFKYPDPMLLS